jgi:hypothetical protein
VKRLVLVLAVATLAGCGGGDSGKATLWITRDRGAHVILQREVPAGLTAMQALDRAADIETRYGGRYVHGINGIEGSFSGRRDWFYFINGYEADRSAAEYKLHDGDVEWWDFRSWKTQMREQVVVGAFPEPFLHGYNGRKRRTIVSYAFPHQRDDARRIARMLHGRVARFGGKLRPRENLFVLVPWEKGLRTVFLADQWPGYGPGDPVRFRYSGDPEKLLENPHFARFRYQVVGE